MMIDTDDDDDDRDDGVDDDAENGYMYVTLATKIENCDDDVGGGR